MKNNALKINENDNVAIATRAITKSEPVVVDSRKLFDAATDIGSGHKVALKPIGPGEPVYRYGEPIVEATRSIECGEWVHVHNTQPIPGDLRE